MYSLIAQGTGDKLKGYEEELKGKILRKPDVVQHGHDLRTGELKRKQLEADVRYSMQRYLFYSNPHSLLVYESTNLEVCVRGDD